MNGRLDTLQAAVLLAKLDVFDEELARREQIAAHLRPPARQSARGAGAGAGQHAAPGRSMRCCCATRRSATRCRRSLRADGVPTAIYYPRPLHQQPAYAAQHDGAALPVSEDLATRILALPIHPDLSDADAERVCDAVAGRSAKQLPGPARRLRRMNEPSSPEDPPQGGASPDTRPRRTRRPTASPSGAEDAKPAGQPDLGPRTDRDAAGEAEGQ